MGASPPTKQKQTCAWGLAWGLKSLQPGCSKRELTFSLVKYKSSRQVKVPHPRWPPCSMTWQLCQAWMSELPVHIMKPNLWGSRAAAQPQSFIKKWSNAMLNFVHQISQVKTPSCCSSWPPTVKQLHYKNSTAPASIFSPVAIPCSVVPDDGGGWVALCTSPAGLEFEWIRHAHHHHRTIAHGAWT